MPHSTSVWVKETEREQEHRRDDPSMNFPLAVKCSFKMASSPTIMPPSLVYPHPSSPALKNRSWDKGWAKHRWLCPWSEKRGVRGCGWRDGWMLRNGLIGWFKGLKISDWKKSRKSSKSNRKRILRSDFAYLLALCMTLNKTPWAPFSLSVKWVSSSFMDFSQEIIQEHFGNYKVICKCTILLFYFCFC